MKTESESSEFEKHLNIMFRNESKWTPAANADVFLDAFIEAVKQDFYNLKYQCYKQNPNKNITAEEAIALTHLKNNDKRPVGLYSPLTAGIMTDFVIMIL